MRHQQLSSALVMRHLIGSGTPRKLQDRMATVITPLLLLRGAPRRWLVAIYIAAMLLFRSDITITYKSSDETTYTTSC